MSEQPKRNPYESPALPVAGTSTESAPPVPSGHDPLGDRLLKLFWWKPAATLAEQVRRRVSVHLLPYLFFLYILAYLDRINVQVAQSGMKLPPSQGGLDFDSKIIGFGAGLFFWGYWILEIPSTLSVAKWGARWVFVRILILWGLAAGLVGLIGLPVMTSMLGWIPTLPEYNFGSAWTGYFSPGYFFNQLPTNAEYQFYFFRFLLGFFEGGFFPSVIVYLSMWFRPRDRAKALAVFMTAIPISSTVGIPFSNLLMYIDWFGLEGWRWVYIIQGIMPFLAGFATLFFLPNNPDQAAFLRNDEREWLNGELEREHVERRDSHAQHGHFALIRDSLGMILLLTLVYFGHNVVSYGLSTFMQPLIKEVLFKDNTAMAALLTSVLYGLATVGILLNGWHSDKTGERVFHVAVPLFLLGTGVILAGLCIRYLHSPGIAVAILVLLVGISYYSHLPAFWPIPSMFLGSTSAAAAIGFINMFGNLGGFFGPYMFGNIVSEKVNGVEVTHYDLGLLVVGPFPIISAVIVLAVAQFRRAQPLPPITNA